MRCFRAGSRRASAAGKGRIREAGADYLAYALLDSIIDHYYPVLESIGAEIDAIEDELVDNPLVSAGRQLA